jgi:diguanylate cyclase (GGDEF)-like protein
MSLQGSLAKDGPILQDIIDHSGDPVLVTRASAKLIFSLAYNRQYERAFKLANTLTANLPEVTNVDARAEALRSIIQMLGLAVEHDQQLKYIKQLDPKGMSRESQCATYSYKVNAISSAVQISSADPDLLQAIAFCLADKQVVFANTLRLDRAILLLQEGHADQAIAMLQKIAPSIHHSQFKPHLTSLYYVFAQAYLSKGSDAKAKSWALKVVKASVPNSFNWPLETAYEALVIVAIVLLMFRLKHSQLRFRKMARHDGLTGAFNRQHFLHEASRILQRLEQADAGACLVVLDLDHFKQINDTYGHSAGDQALRRVVEICRRELRGSDLFGRLGGEEFGVLMPASTCEQGVEIASRIAVSLSPSCSLIRRPRSWFQPVWVWRTVPLPDIRSINSLPPPMLRCIAPSMVAATGWWWMRRRWWMPICQMPPALDLLVFTPGFAPRC